MTAPNIYLKDNPDNALDAFRDALADFPRDLAVDSVTDVSAGTAMDLFAAWTRSLEECAVVLAQEAMQDPDAMIKIVEDKVTTTFLPAGNKWGGPGGLFRDLISQTREMSTSTVTITLEEVQQPGAQECFDCVADYRVHFGEDIPAAPMQVGGYKEFNSFERADLYYHQLLHCRSLNCSFLDEQRQLGAVITSGR